MCTGTDELTLHTMVVFPPALTSGLVGETTTGIGGTKQGKKYSVKYFIYLRIYFYIIFQVLQLNK